MRLADVVRRHGPAYLERFGRSLLPSHARALRAIAHCRTPEMGGHLGECGQCGRTHLLYHSCRHRACPQCGHDATAAWLAQQRNLLLPVPYFHVTFTLPDELRRLVRSQQRTLFSVLFRAAFESLAALCADPHYLGARIGALAVLHTWTRQLEWHPHVHMLVPGGGLAPDGRTWRRARRTRAGKPYLVPVRALSKHFRARLLHLARRALPGVVFPEIPWNKRWVVDIRPAVPGADRLLEYLGRYVHRTAITDKAIISTDDGSVTFTYRDNRDHRRKSMKTSAHDFLRRFLQHVLPRGVHRVRFFGLLHRDHRSTLRRLQHLLAPGTDPRPSVSPPPSRPGLRCPYCISGVLRLVRRFTAAEYVLLGLAAHVARAPPAIARGAPS